jgi:hemerythrin-like domain-containing protein
VEALSREHKNILRIADVLESMSRQAQAEFDYDKQDAEAIAGILSAYGDDLHQAKEEGVLFPIFTAVCDVSQQAAVRHMIFEHGQDRALIAGLKDSIARSNAPQFAEYAIRLAQILRSHIYKEDNILFEIIENLLSREDDARIIAEFEASDKEFQEQDKGHALAQLCVLEWRYIRKGSTS